ncbi:MAG: hypothetical protein ACOYMN_20555, partial [Roseimicrobium sp.]
MAPEAAVATLSIEERLQKGYDVIATLPQRSPRELAKWLRTAAGLRSTSGVANVVGFDAVALRLGRMELRPLLEQHAEPGAQVEAFEAYARCLLSPDGEGWVAAWSRLSDIAATAAPRLAHEFCGDIHMRKGLTAAALESWLLEAVHSDAVRSRE